MRVEVVAVVSGCVERQRGGARGTEGGGRSSVAVPGAGRARLRAAAAAAPQGVGWRRSLTVSPARALVQRRV